MDTNHGVYMDLRREAVVRFGDTHRCFDVRCRGAMSEGMEKLEAAQLVLALWRERKFPVGRLKKLYWKGG